MDDALSAGMDALRTRDFARAADLLIQAVRANPNDARAQMALGAALTELQRWDEAIGALSQAAALAPNVPAAHYNLGNALEKAGRSGEARDAYTRAVQLDPAHERAAAALQRLPQAPPPVVQSSWSGPMIGDASAQPPGGPAAPVPGAPVTGGPVGTWAGGAIPPAPAAPPLYGGAIPADVYAAQTVEARYDPAAPNAGVGVPVGGAPPEPGAAPTPTGPVLLGEAANAPPPRNPVAAAAAARPPEDALKQRGIQFPMFSSLLIFLIPLVAFGSLALGIYRTFINPPPAGAMERRRGDRQIRAAYEALDRGLEAPDASEFAGLVPTSGDREVSPIEIQAKTRELKSQKWRCEIRVNGIRMAGNEDETPKEATATVTVKIGSGNSPMQTRRGRQVWRLQKGRWVPRPERSNWTVFGDAPLSFNQ